MTDKGLSRRNLMKLGAGAAAANVIPSGLPGSEVARPMTAVAQQEPIDYVNVLFGTASLDDPALIGNAPPLGEELYTGMVCPGAALPHGIDVSPVNKDIAISYPHGNLYAYTHPRRTLIGFACFKVIARNNSEKNVYIQSAVLNGEPLLRPWFAHASLAMGGELVLQMTNVPNKGWGSGPEAAPPSMTA